MDKTLCDDTLDNIRDIRVCTIYLCLTHRRQTHVFFLVDPHNGALRLSKEICYLVLRQKWNLMVSKARVEEIQDLNQEAEEAVYKESPDPRRLERLHNRYRRDNRNVYTLRRKLMRFRTTTLLDMFAHDGTPLTYEQILVRLASRSITLDVDWGKVGKRLFQMALAAGLIYVFYKGYQHVMNEYENEELNDDQLLIRMVHLFKPKDEKRLDAIMTNEKEKKKMKKELRTMFHPDKLHINKANLIGYKFLFTPQGLKELPINAKQREELLNKLNNSSQQIHQEISCTTDCGTMPALQAYMAAMLNALTVKMNEAWSTTKTEPTRETEGDFPEEAQEINVDELLGRYF